jgi:EcoRII C terminal
VTVPNFRLFKLVERQICLPEVRRLFKDIDDFLKTAATLMNRRKSRAGRSFENHIEYLLRQAGIPFEIRPAIDGEPDVIIPGKAAYDDMAYPSQKLFMLGLKTTCKDRWRQILQEAPRVKFKHLITMQEGISAKQLLDIHRHKVSLVVPRKLHNRFPNVDGVRLLDVEKFFSIVRERLAL